MKLHEKLLTEELIVHAHIKGTSPDYENKFYLNFILR